MEAVSGSAVAYDGCPPRSRCLSMSSSMCEKAWSPMLTDDWNWEAKSAESSTSEEMKPMV